MPILLKKKNGEITPFRNAEYISAFYFIPKSILDKCGEEINSIPRNPRKLLQDRRAIEVIESDLFKLVIIDAYAFMVWPFMGLGAKREIYSGYEPSWRYAHAASIWIKGMEDEGVIPKSQEILKSSNVDEDLRPPVVSVDAEFLQQHRKAEIDDEHLGDHRRTPHIGHIQLEQPIDGPDVFQPEQGNAES